MAITAADVNKLRQMTGAGMMDCKKALDEAQGDFDAAIDILRKKGQKVSAARADRETTEGAVLVNINPEGTEATLVALGCETDFVAKNEDFTTLGRTILNAAVENKVASGEELQSLQVGGRAVSDLLSDMMGKIGEKISVVAFERVTGDKVASYIHSNSKVGVIVGFTGVDGTDVTEVGKDVALQIASMRPVAVDESSVDQKTIERELEIGRDQARQEGKPEAMIDKIAQGKLNAFYKEYTLLNQAFVKDNKKSIRQLLEGTAKGLTVSGFKRVEIGK